MPVTRKQRFQGEELKPIKMCIEKPGRNAGYKEAVMKSRRTGKKKYKSALRTEAKCGLQ